MKNAGVLAGISLAGGLMSLWLWSGCSEDVTAPEPVILPGAIAISSIPSGAAISLDEAETGLVTPDTINNVLSGTRLVKLSLANFYDTSLSVQVYSNQSTKVAVIMTPLSEYGILILSSNPSGAQIFSQNRYLGTTPLTIYNVVPGYYILVFKLEGYLDYAKDVNILEGQIASLLADWQALGYGSLLISSLPPYAKILLDGFYRGATPLRFDEVLAGSHAIELSLANYLNSYDTIYLGSGRDNSLNLTQW